MRGSSLFRSSSNWYGMLAAGCAVCEDYVDGGQQQWLKSRDCVWNILVL